eukprot:EG_transcript_6240
MVTVALALVPAVTIWVVFMDLMTASVDLLKGTTQDSTNDMVESIQELLILRAIDKFDARLTEGDREMTAMLAAIKANGLQKYDLRPSRFDIPNKILTPFWSPGFSTMRGHPYFTSIGIFGGVFQNPSDTYATRLFWMSWVSLYLDVLKKDFNLTLYCSTLAMDPDEQRTTVNVTYVDQETGEALQQINHLVAPAAAYTMGNDPGGWADTLSFNPYTGQVELPTWQWLPAQNNTALQAFISISAATISDGLREELSGSPDDRLVLFFRQPHGYMIAASHGKYWSNSDEDFRSVIPLAGPPNISAYRLWNCTHSTDGLIQQACLQLYAVYQSWPAIPALRQNTVLGGQRYWLATGFSTGSLRVTVLLLKNRASVMSGIDACNAFVDQSVADRKDVTFVILAVVSTLAVCLPLLVGYWLAAWLCKLAVKMDCIAQLRFSTTNAEPTVFQELHRFQDSFTQMERGLQAFGKFVPQAVVRVLIAGKMMINEQMHPETLTVMFADIEGFSTMCEAVSPTVLVAVCTEYFEAMCSNIVQRNGTIDKFIGDCIMAMWNAPDPLVGHEREAVATALAMQSSVMELHQSWKLKGLPLLRFRLGIHTGVCLVGNFGCSYRVSYTCLGDAVNLSARLEALNKKFGTYLCVSHATYE